MRLARRGKKGRSNAQKGSEVVKEKMIQLHRSNTFCVARRERAALERERGERRQREETD